MLERHQEEVAQGAPLIRQGKYQGHVIKLPPTEEERAAAEAMAAAADQPPAQEANKLPEKQVPV